MAIIDLITNLCMTLYIIGLLESIYDYKYCQDQKIKQTVWISRMKNDFDRLVYKMLITTRQK